MTSALSSEESALLAPVDPDRMLTRACEWSAINSGTGNLPGLARQADALADAFSALPGEVALVEPDPLTAIDETGDEVSIERGRHLVVSVRPEANRRVLLTGHMDTVFPASTDFTAISEIEPGVLNGPGLADMKGGIAVIAEALMAFETSPSASALGYDVMINSDEEAGSGASARLIDKLASDKLAALTYEPTALPDGTLAGGRGGSGNYAITVRGKSAHAGRNPEDGRNALVAAADLVLRLKDLETGDLPVNPARIEGGSANNVVPDLAVVRFNIRPKNEHAAARFTAVLDPLCKDVAAAHDVEIAIHGGISRPPKPVDEGAEKLFGIVAESAGALGQHYARKNTGGVCDGNNIAACGVPVVDTMGVRGGAIHSPDEFLIVASLAERARLSALVLHRLATGVAL